MAGEVTEKHLLGGLEHKGNKKADICKNIKLSVNVYEKYFANVRDADVAGIVESALAAWFKKEGVDDY